VKLLIAGSRSIAGRDGWIEVMTALRDAGYRTEIGLAFEPKEAYAAFPKDRLVTEVVSGCAPGVDQIGIDWAVNEWLPWKEFPADWEKHGKAAGIIRNKEMGDYADALVAVWDGKSRGTAHMIEYMQSLGKPVFIRIVDGDKNGASSDEEA